MVPRIPSPRPIHTAWRPRRTRLKASPSLADHPRAAKAAALAPSSVPRLAGTKKVAKRTPVPSASMTVAVVTDTGTYRLRTMSSTSSVPTSQLAKWRPTAMSSDRQCER
jgi:hypothetical protein